jgi:hypothetical protein
MQVELEIKQFDSHFSLEDKGFTFFYFLAFLSLTIFLVFKCISFCKGGTDEEEDFDYA